MSDLDPRRRPGAAPARGRPAVPAPRPARACALEPGSVTIEDGVIAALRGRPGADVRDRRARRRHPAGLRRLPHAPAVRRLARGGVRAEGHRRAVRGDRARRRRDRLVGARVRRPRPTATCSRRRAASGDEMLAHGTTTFEGKTGYGLSREGELRAGAARPARLVRRPRHRRCSRTPSRQGYDADELDGRGRLRWRADGATSTRSTSTSSRSRSATRTSSGWARSRGARACRCARTSSSSTPTARCRSRSRPARARSTTSPACTRDDLAPLAAAECAAVLLPGAEFLGAEERRPGPRRWPTRARSACWPPTATPAPRPCCRCR